MDKVKTTEDTLKDLFHEKLTGGDTDNGIIITHIVWKIDRKSQDFMGMGWIEMSCPNAASKIVALSKHQKIKSFGRALKIDFQPPDSKDIWPPSNSKV
jgi:hypothetical protein